MMKRFLLLSSLSLVVIFFLGCSSAMEVPSPAPPDLGGQWAQANAEAKAAQANAEAKTDASKAAGRQYFSCLQASQEAIVAEKENVASAVIPPTAIIKVVSWGKEGISFVEDPFGWALKVQPNYLEIWLGGNFKGLVEKKYFSQSPGRCYQLDPSLSVATDGKGVEEVGCPPTN